MNNKPFTDYNHFLLKNNVSRETIEILNKFIELLQKWNKTINLIGKSTEDDIWFRHIFDCAQIINYINNEIIVTDFGSGAGFPGLILSFMGIKKVNLIESDSRKAAFLNEAAMLSSNKVYIHNSRIEELEPWKTDLITARALARLPALIELTTKFRDKDTKSIFLKGKQITEELQQAKLKYNFDYKLYNSQTNHESWLIEINGVNLISKKG
jgi:16S rRNA (guanine527-N7)-methyltransferase